MRLFVFRLLAATSTFLLLVLLLALGSAGSVVMLNFRVTIGILLENFSKPLLKERIVMRNPLRESVLPFDLLSLLLVANLAKEERDQMQHFLKEGGSLGC
jgi:hypothetical protein